MCEGTTIERTRGREREEEDRARGWTTEKGDAEEEEEGEETRRSLSTLSCVLPRSEKSHVRAV